jgi:uncharacterized protein YpmS
MDLFQCRFQTILLLLALSIILLYIIYLERLEFRSNKKHQRINKSHNIDIKNYISNLSHDDKIFITEFLNNINKDPRYKILNKKDLLKDIKNGVVFGATYGIFNSLPFNKIITNAIVMGSIKGSLHVFEKI